MSMALFYSGCLTSILSRFHPSSQKRKERRADGRMEGLRPYYTFGRSLECHSYFGKTDSDSLEVRPRIKCPTQRKEYRAL